ncbi:MAG: tRNA 2-thiocytidine biosynthesis TtcA family protein [Lachnospiraceae bacterium]|nr:tRNA 2-thiocytidine biosynthesis TtcA family protein [Lachnospiraceae bacterium]
MKSQQLLSRIRQAVQDFDMIKEGDKIAVGISGGKDSLCLLYGLAKLREFYPVKFDIVGVTVNMGFKNVDFDSVKNYCNSLNVEYHVIDTTISDIIFNIRKESNPCSLCAKLRKGAINDYLVKIGYNKLAYAHHFDDFIETFMMSLIYEGRVNTFSPVTFLDKTEITVIRPLLYVTEAEVKGFCNKYEIPVLKSACPADGFTKREYVKNLIKDINKDNPGVKKRLFTAAVNEYRKGLN